MNKDKVMSIIRKKSNESGVSINTLLLLYFFERFLTRISESQYKTNLILKGGFLLSSIMGIETRTTMDMDMSLTNRNLDAQTISEVINNISQKTSADDVTFEINGVNEIKIEDKYPGYKINMIGRLQNIRQPFSIDIATGDPITPSAIEYNYKSVFDSNDKIEILSYNLETIVAEKLETVVSRKTDNSRSKDFYDLYLVLSLQKDKIDVSLLKEAVQTTFRYRGTDFSLQEMISDLINIQEDSGFKKRWDTYCKKNEYVDKIDFDRVINCIINAIQEIYK